MFDFVKTVNGEVEIDFHSLNVPELNAVLERDKSKFKKRAQNELLYIASVATFTSPYFHWPEYRQQKELGEQIFGEKFVPDRKVQKAIDALIEHQKRSIPAFRYYVASKAALDRLTEHIENFDPTILDDDGRPIFQTKDLITYIKEAGPLAEALDALYNKIMESNFKTTKTKSNKEINFFEK